MNNSELIKLGVEHGSYPKYLYRFRNLDENFNGIIEQNSLWFSQPDKFNDPFDCKVNFNHEYSGEMVLNWLINENRISQFEANQLMKNLNKKNLSKIIEDTINSNLQNTHICCFAQDKNDILMWSHYTNSHKGACLVFDITKDPDFFLYPIHVKYDDNYPEVNYLKDTKKAIDTILTTKAKLWEYENEIRVIKPFSRENQFYFKKESLVEIIFGCNTEMKKIQEIKELTTKFGFSHLKFSKASTNPKEFKLDFNSI